MNSATRNCQTQPAGIHQTLIGTLMLFIILGLVHSAAAQAPTQINLDANRSRFGADIYFVGMGKEHPNQVMMAFNACNSFGCTVTGPAAGSGGLRWQSGVYTLTVYHSLIGILTLKNAQTGEWSVQQSGHLTFLFDKRPKTLLGGDLQLVTFTQAPGKDQGIANQGKAVNLTNLSGIDSDFFSAEALAKTQTVAVGGRVLLTLKFPSNQNLQSLLGTNKYLERVSMSSGTVEGCPDADGDGLCDDWETSGMTVNGVFVDLPAMGAHPGHKDIFLQEDAMRQFDVWRTLPQPPPAGVKPAQVLTPGHTHKPSIQAVANLVQAFAKSPNMNPDNVTGIDLHVDCGWDCLMKPKPAGQECATGEKTIDGTTYCTWGTGPQNLGFSKANSELRHNSCLGDTTIDDRGLFYQFRKPADKRTSACVRNFNENPDISPFFDDLKALTLIPAGRSAAFHYGIFSHSLGGDVQQGNGRLYGLSRSLPGSDIVLGMGYGVQQANRNMALWLETGVPMHELGHNLGLRHGGADSVINKPNYLSVMNYLFAYKGLVVNNAQGAFDYSRFGDLPDLNERNLDEGTGINGGNNAIVMNLKNAKLGTIYYCPGPRTTLWKDAWTWIDWNCNGNLSPPGVHAYINRVGVKGQLGVLTGKYNDWFNLNFVGGAVGNLVPPGREDDNTWVREVTLGDDAQLPVPYGVSAALTKVIPDDVPASDIVPTTRTNSGVFSVLPGHIYYVNFQVKNEGTEDDTYDLIAESESPWVDLNGLPSIVSLAAGTSENFLVALRVPDDAGTDEAAEIALRAVGELNANVADVAQVRAVVAMADMSIAAKASAGVIKVGQNLTYTVTITNRGPQAASGYVFDALPDNAAFVSATPSSGQCQFDSARDQADFSLPPQTVACDVGELAVGSKATVEIVMTPIAPGRLSNVVTAGGSLPDPQTGDNLAQTVVQVQP